MAVHAYCLFCETQRCAAIAERIERKYGITCISPRVIQRKWVKGQCVEQAHGWLPGYIFCYSETPMRPYFDIPGIIRWLGRDEMKGRDFDFAMVLWRCGGVMGAVDLAEIGDVCVVDDPLWIGMKGRVVKLDRGRRRCCIEFEFDSVTRRVWLGYELVRKAEAVTALPGAARETVISVSRNRELEG